MKGPPLPALSFDTLNAALAAAAMTKKGLTLVDSREQERPLSFNELYTRARRMAAALLARGIRPGDRVAMVLPTGEDFMHAFFGTLLAGAVPVALYPPVRLGRMDEYVRSTARMLTTCGARMVLSDRRVRLLLGGAVELARPDLGCPTVAELMDSTSEAEEQVTSSALGLIQFSSGSTVDPKPVALSHANILAQCAALKALLPQVEGTEEKGVSWLPLYHDMGLIGCLLLAVYWPGDLILLPPELFLAKPSLWLRALSRHRGTISPAPNFAYGLCLKRVRDEEIEGLDLSAWSYALNGAEPVSTALNARFIERYAPKGFRAESLMPVYGLSEASLAVTFSARTTRGRELNVDAEALASTREVKPGTRAIATVGSPVPGCEIEVRDDDGHELADRKVGRVWAKAPFVMTGYFGNPAATAKALVDGWLDTGDLGFVADGQLFLCGRAKDLVIIRGANHAPQEFEECLESLSGVRTGCAVALGFVPPGNDDESLLILAETADDADDTLVEQIRAAVVERTSVKPHTVMLLAPGTLPRTSSGKLRRAEALRLFQAGELKAPQKVTALRVGAEVARSMLSFARGKLSS